MIVIREGKFQFSWSICSCESIVRMKICLIFLHTFFLPIRTLWEKRLFIEKVNIMILISGGDYELKTEEVGRDLENSEEILNTVIK